MPPSPTPSIHPSHTSPTQPVHHIETLWQRWTLLALVTILLWDAAGQDRWLAHAFGSLRGFPLRDHWFFVGVLHEGARRLAWALAFALVLSVWWPWGPLRRLDTADRLQMAMSTLLALACIALLKNVSWTSCPWDLAEFGGLARYASHWALLTRDGGAGHCFPAGHASAGFAFVGSYFVLQRRQPRLARGWLAGALAAGFLLGLAQQARGAHFMSHTLWTAWLCWTTGWLCHLLRNRFTQRRQPQPGVTELTRGG